MAEIGFYSPSTGWGQKARLSAIARHLPLNSVMAYTMEGGQGNAPYDHFGVSWVAAQCLKPGCSGVGPQKFAAFIADRQPERLVMDAWPYGAMLGELHDYVRRRDPLRTFFTSRRNPYVEAPTYNFDPADFGAVIKFENGPTPGIDLYPIVPFDQSEIMSRAEARLYLGASQRPLVMILSSGHTSPDMVSFARRECEKRGLDHVVWTTYPAMPYFAGADLVVTFAGSVVTELECVGVPYKAVAAHDSADQAFRMNTSPDDLASSIAELEVAESWVVSYENHARRAAAIIMGNPNWEDVDG